MICNKCGTENPDKAVFCKVCGAVLNQEESTDDNIQMNIDEGEKETNSFIEQDADQPKGKNISKKALGGGIVAIIAIIVIICIALRGGNTINLDKYLSIQTEGYDGYGQAYATIDWEAIEEKYEDKISFTKEAQSEMGFLSDLGSPIQALEYGVYVTIDNDQNLSNGDEVSYQWSIDEELFKYIDCKLKYKDGNITVSGLEKAETFDAFKDLSVDFSGVGPNGEVNITYSGENLDYTDFNCEPETGLSNGDKVTITIDEYAIDRMAEATGKVPETPSKEYTVEGLDKYLTKINEIGDEGLKDLQAQAEDCFNAYVARHWDEGEDLESLTYIGDYLLTSKDADAWDTNKLYLVYNAKVHNNYTDDDGNKYDKTNDIYWYICYKDITVDPEGNLKVDLTDYSTPYDSFEIDSELSDRWWGTKSWSYDGYPTLDELYKNTVTASLENYNHEDNVEAN